MSVLNEYQSKAKDLNDFINKNGTQIANEALKAMMSAMPEDINAFILQGYTPGFNDGDPCYHQSNLMTRSEMKECAEENEEFMYAILGLKEEDELEDDIYDIFEELDLGDSNSRELHAVNDLLSGGFEELFESVLGTDWQVLVVRKDDGGFIIIHEEYDCGY